MYVTTSPSATEDLFAVITAYTVSSSSVILFVTGVASNPNFSKLPTALGFSCDTDVILLEIESSSLYTSSLFTVIVNVPVLPSAITPFPKSLPFL